MRFSILIPTHNRSAILRRTLEGLAGLEQPAGAQLELIVIANACTDDTAAVVADFAARSAFPARVVAEPEPGVAHARNRALREARGEIVFFLDDDILVEPGWLQAHLAIYAAHPADLVAGKITLWTQERQPPEWLLGVMHSVMSWKDLGDRVLEITSPGDCISGNLSMRRQVFERAGEFKTGLGRKGTSLLGGEEIEFVARALRQGARAFYAPQALGKHWVPARFMERDFLCRLAFDRARTRVFMKERLGFGRVANRMLLSPLRIAGHQLGEWLGQARGDPCAALTHRIKRMKRWGGLVATCQHLAGRSPLHQK